MEACRAERSMSLGGSRLLERVGPHPTGGVAAERGGPAGVVAAAGPLRRASR
jgi:hypothetical protein